MKIQAKQGDRSVFDLEATVARALIASGTHVAYVAPEPVRTPNTTWKTGWLPAQLGFAPEPAITYCCATCMAGSRPGMMTGPTVHRTGVFRHCGVTETVPRHIAAQYACMRKQLADRQKVREQSSEVKKPHFLNVF